MLIKNSLFVSCSGFRFRLMSNDDEQCDLRLAVHSHACDSYNGILVCCSAIRQCEVKV